MSPKALIRHHTGRMAGPARWYLAVLAMVSLGLLAAHFAVQEHVQKKMRLAVHAWLQDSGGSVQYVRYRLLRGALTLERVHWAGSSDSGMALDVSRVFIQTSSQAMSVREPFFSLLRFENPVLSVRRSTLLEWLRGDSDNSLTSLAALLGHAQSVAVNDMRLHISLEKAASAPAEIRIQGIGGSMSADGMRLSGKLDAGVLQLEGKVDAGGKLAGSIALGGISLDSLAILSGVAASSPAGVKASGDLLFSGDWNKRDVAMQGVLGLQGDSGKGSLSMQGGWSTTGTAMEVKCDNVPLASLPLVWPTFAGRTLKNGLFGGDIHFERSWHEVGWQVGMNGEMTGVQLVALDLPEWQIHSLQLKGATLWSETGAFVAKEVLIADADIALNAFSRPAAEATAIIPEIATLNMQHIHSRLHFMDGSELVLPELEGSGRLGRLGKVSLSSVRGDADNAESTAVETWKIQAEGDFLSSWQATLTAGYVPVVRLRPLLPDLSLPGEQGIPEYSGTSEFSLQLNSAAQGLRVAGSVVLHDARMTQGGDQLTATRIEVEIADAGTDGRRKLSSVRLNDWQYQVALRPLSRYMQPDVKPMLAVPAEQVLATKSDHGAAAGPAVTTQTGVDKVETGVAAIQTATSPALNWEIGELVASQGRISLGYPDALMAGKLLFSVRHLAKGRLSPFTLSGDFGGGALRSQGKLQWQPSFRMSAKTKVRGALPFIFNDWMRLSGMPRFVRGRMNADLRLDTDGANAGAYVGRLTLGLYQGVLETGAFPDDPILQRSGYPVQGLLDRLNKAGKLSVSTPFKGDWDELSLVPLLGEAVLDVLKKDAEKVSSSAKRVEPAIGKITRLRLHAKKGFSHNERVRLRQMIRYLRKDKGRIVELAPQLGTATLNDKMIERVLHSQRQVEHYLRRRGIARKRIYPVWPQPTQQKSDAPGLLLRARAF